MATAIMNAKRIAASLEAMEATARALAPRVGIPFDYEKIHPAMQAVKRAEALAAWLAALNSRIAGSDETVVEPFFKITRDEQGAVVNVEELVAPTPTRRRSTKRIRRADEEPEDGA
jgi:hypothetical protein